MGFLQDSWDDRLDRLLGVSLREAEREAQGITEEDAEPTALNNLAVPEESRGKGVGVQAGVTGVARVATGDSEAETS